MPTLNPPALTASRTEWALWWASRGWRVFPLCSPEMGDHIHFRAKEACDKDLGKTPMVGGGFKPGTCDPAQIREWWSKWPNANIGSTPPDDHFVIDIDGELDEGLEFPATWTHRSGKGEHLLYRQNITKPVEQTQTQNRYWTNVDTRVSGKGYIVLPPSLHKSGKHYELASMMTPTVFPAEMIPARTKAKRAPKQATPTPETSDVLRLLLAPRDAPELGDDAMAVVAGYLARHIPDREHWEAIMGCVNLSLAEPLPESAMAKKAGIWEKHQGNQEAKEQKALDDESRGWLFELGDTGYTTLIESRDNVESMPWSDFRVQAKGLVVEPDSQVWIVDFTRADGTVLANQRLNSHVLANVSALRAWLLNRGMVLYSNQQDKRQHHGTRLVKLMQSQGAPVLHSRDYYGWCDQTQAFLTVDGEVTSEGLRSFTEVYPEDRLSTDSPTAYRWDVDLVQARDWLDRLLRLQDEAESVKIGAWLMMLFLRGQWNGRLPGLLVNASAGSGKTLFFQCLSKMAGTPSEGEDPTMPVARDMLAGNSSGFVWLDDVSTNEQMEQLLRKAMTQGRVLKKEKGDNGQWQTKHIPLRGSAIISGEGTDFYRQKAMRDRFVDVEFGMAHRTKDAEVLAKSDLGAASGVLLQEALRQAHRLPELEALRSDVMERDHQAQATLRIGARILDAVMATGSKYTDLIDVWHSGKAKASDQGHASENVLHVFPSLWVSLGYPHQAGANGIAFPIWYDEVTEVFWVAGKKVAEAWNDRKNVSQRQRQLTSPDAIRKELDACQASNSANKRVPGSRSTLTYRSLPKRYSAMVLRLAEVEQGEDTLSD
jgi:hypothetical protein